MRGLLRGLGLAVLATTLLGVVPTVSADEAGTGVMPETAGPLLYQNSMNVFRRFHVDAAKVFEFYGDVLGLEQLRTFNVGGGQQVARFQIGSQQVKFTARTPDRKYQPGGIKNATGLRLLTFFFSDETALAKKFTDHGLPAPEFKSVKGAKWTYAFVDDPDGQPVELVVIPDATKETYESIEVGLSVSDMEASRAFYRSFVGLKELPPAQDPVLGTTVYGFRHGTTTINLRHFGDNLPADTGSGGIQYVVTDAAMVDKMAKARQITIEQPFGVVTGFGLKTIWLNDPDGITNYFAETPQSGKAQAAGSTQ